MIAHRLGQIPLKIDSTIKGNSTEITLEESGPKRIYSKNIIFPPGIKAVSQNIIIADLGINESIKLTGNLEEGSVIENNHHKFSVSAGTSYKKINDELFHFYIETTGTISAKDALISSLQILKDELNCYKKMI
jgi:DNA-directed RNA polymerase alpha subunit